MEPGPLEVTAAPPRAVAWGLVGLAAVLLLVGLRTDATGALLALPAAAVALAVGLRDALLVPVLHADAQGLVVVQGLHRVRARWDEVTGLRVVQDRRAVLLEVDLGEQVVLLSRARLGRDPRDVLDELVALQAAGHH